MGSARSSSCGIMIPASTSQPPPHLALLLIHGSSPTPSKYMGNGFWLMCFLQAFTPSSVPDGTADSIPGTAAIFPRQRTTCRSKTFFPPTLCAARKAASGMVGATRMQDDACNTVPSLPCLTIPLCSVLHQCSFVQKYCFIRWMCLI